jgi:hypothetical protein
MKNGIRRRKRPAEHAHFTQHIFDGDVRPAYRGQCDDSRPSSGIAFTGRDARAAVDALVAGKQPAAEQKASIGCNIK